MRYVFEIEYDGKNYCGWQRQKNGISVQERVEEALSSLLKKAVKVTGAGRTDAGVHAMGMIAHSDFVTSVPAKKIAPAINSLLEGDISVKRSAAAPEGFHARYSAVKKTYEYNIVFSKVKRPLSERYAARSGEGADEVKIAEALNKFVGIHDFKAFCSTGSSVKSTVREIYLAAIQKEGDILKIKICGNGFLYNMVRIIAGTVLEIGQGRRDMQDIERAFETGKRIYAGKTLPPNGLVLKSIEYPYPLFEN